VESLDDLLERLAVVASHRVPPRYHRPALFICGSLAASTRTERQGHGTDRRDPGQALAYCLHSSRLRWFGYRHGMRASNMPWNTRSTYLSAACVPTICTHLHQCPSHISPDRRRASRTRTCSWGETGREGLSAAAAGRRR